MATRAAKATGFPNKAIAHCTTSTFSGHEGNVRDITSSGRLRMNITPFGGSPVRTSFRGPVSGNGWLRRCVRIERFCFPQDAQSFGGLSLRRKYIINFRFVINLVSNVC